MPEQRGNYFDYVGNKLTSACKCKALFSDMKRICLFFFSDSHI